MKPCKIERIFVIGRGLIMLAVIDKQNNEYVVQFDRHFSYSIEEVWSVLTENSKLKNGCLIYRLKA